MVLRLVDSPSSPNHYTLQNVHSIYLKENWQKYQSNNEKMYVFLFCIGTHSFKQGDTELRGEVCQNTHSKTCYVSTNLNWVFSAYFFKSVSRYRLNIPVSHTVQMSFFYLRMRFRWGLLRASEKKLKWRDVALNKSETISWQIVLF